MKLTVTLIEYGRPREAIPVRALPFVTGWNFSPDAIANTFSKTDEVRRMRGIMSFQITANSLIPVKAVDWEHVKVALDGLDQRLPSGPEGYANWRTESVKLLPAGVFVWLNEFETAFQSDFSPSNWLPDCRGEYPSLNLEPMQPEGMTSIIREGFPLHEEQTEAPVIGGQSMQTSSTNANDTKVRTSQLTAEIEKAKSLAIDPDDYQSVWPELSKMALEEKGAFTGETDPKKGLEYKAHNGKGEQTRKWLSIGALRKRMNPSAR